MIINGVNFVPTGDPNADLKTYAAARGVDVATAKNELETALGNPDVAAAKFVGQSDDVSVLDTSSNSTKSTTSTTSKSSSGSVVDGSTTSSSSAQAGFTEEQLEELRTAVRLLEESNRTEADCYQNWMANRYNFWTNKNAESIYWQSVTNNAQRADELVAKLNQVDPALLNDEVASALRDLIGAIAEEDGRYNVYMQGGSFEDFNKAKDMRAQNSSNLIRVIHETGIFD